MNERDPFNNRRRHPRVPAPSLRYRRINLDSPLNPLINIGLGGMRVYSDRQIEVGQLLDIELFLPDGTPLRCRAEVRWLEPVENDPTANYDLGLKFVHIADEDLMRLTDFLEK